MFNPNQNNPFAAKLTLSPSAKIVFVSDMFLEDYTGGAELTSQALIDACPFEVQKLHSNKVTMDLLEQGVEKFWIFGNFSQINPQLIPTIVGNIKYSILEYDYKYCKFRSPEKHFEMEKVPCDCHNQINGKIISAFFYGAKSLWWMSEKQKQRYHTAFPFLSDRDNVVLSSVFDPKTLASIKLLRDSKTASTSRQGWIVLGSSSWVKGFEQAEKWCKDNNKQYEVVWNVPYDDLLAKLSMSEGFVYLPAGADTCPRMVIEAKLLGCELHINENVQHKDEEWFATDDIETIESYLYAARGLFWNGIKFAIDHVPTISGYTTTLNCIKQEYPHEKCIQSMLNFCNEVCVLDGGSTDGTWEKLVDWAKQEPKLKVKQVVRDWESKESALFDGQQKAEARSMCSMEFCWQMDADEVVHQNDSNKIHQMINGLSLSPQLKNQSYTVSLPVVEWWGSYEKIRCDINHWKARLTPNHPDITHGIPIDCRTSNGFVKGFQLPQTDGFVGPDPNPTRTIISFHENTPVPVCDGCDYILKSTGKIPPGILAVSQEAETQVKYWKRQAILGDEVALQEYENWFNKWISEVCPVFHFSWIDIERKIRLYRDFWTRHWVVLMGQEYQDTKEHNMFFDKPWGDVTNEEIKELAYKLATETGGHIFHVRWTGDKIPAIKCKREFPTI